MAAALAFVPSSLTDVRVRHDPLGRALEPFVGAQVADLRNQCTETQRRTQVPACGRGLPLPMIYPRN